MAHLSGAMWSEFAIDYSILVFFSTLGTMQIIAATNGLAGIMLIRGRSRLSTCLGLGLIVASFCWFFESDFRNLPDTGAGLEANTQTATFALAASAAVGVTFLAASIVNHRWASSNAHGRASGETMEEGLGVLRRTTFVVANVARFEHWALLRRTRGSEHGKGTESDG